MHIKSEDSITGVFSKILDLSARTDSWPLILKSKSIFLFSNDSIDSVWNNFAAMFGFPNISSHFKSNSTKVLQYKNCLIEYEIRGDRTNNIFEVLKLSELIAEDFKVFYCADSWHSSDLAFIAVPKTKLNDIPNNEKSQRFIPAPSSYEEFESLAFSKNHQRIYGGKDINITVENGLLPAPTDWILWFKEKGINVGWRYYCGELKDPNKVPASGYEGWYLQEVGRISKTNEGLFFKECIVTEKYFRLFLVREGFNKKAWEALEEITLRFSNSTIVSGGVIYTREHWARILGSV